jgi:hypothetical protein
MGQVQFMFEEFNSSTSVQAGLYKAAGLYQTLLQFKSNMPDQFEHFERVPRSMGLVDLDSPDGQRVILCFTICGMFLQLKMLVLLPMLETIVWSTIRQRPSVLSKEKSELADECARTALAMVRSVV